MRWLACVALACGCRSDVPRADAVGPACIDAVYTGSLGTLVVRGGGFERVRGGALVPAESGAQLGLVVPPRVRPYIRAVRVHDDIEVRTFDENDRMLDRFRFERPACGDEVASVTWWDTSDAEIANVRYRGCGECSALALPVPEDLPVHD